MEIRTVRQRGAETGETGEAAEVLRALGFPASVRQNEGLAVARVSRRRARAARLVRLVRLTWKVRRARLLRGVRGSRLLTEERGAVTAEYALVIMAKVWR
ncbi:hypothetical protein ACFSWE_03985 [Leucobacter albus]|uniref:Uncharacterized protein n=1 Tax=Leucobacter albus TaxID=272210 RepID=A0ABW3TRF4_9MICO